MARFGRLEFVQFLEQLRVFLFDLFAFVHELGLVTQLEPLGARQRHVFELVVKVQAVRVRADKLDRIGFLLVCLRIRKMKNIRTANDPNKKIK